MFDLIVMACVAVIIVHWMSYIDNLDDKKARKKEWM